MVAAGLPAVIANVSSTVALFPGTLASTLRPTGATSHRASERSRFRSMLPITLAGGLVGAVLLLATPARLFDAIIPFLLLLATLTFAFGARAGLALRRVVPVGPGAMLADAVPDLDLWRLLRRRRRADDDGHVEPADGERRSEGNGAARVLLVSAANGAAVRGSSAPARSAGRRRWRCWVPALWAATLGRG